MIDIGRNVDAYLYEDTYTKLSPLDYALIYCCFCGIRWLIQSRHGNIHQKDQDGYDPIDKDIKAFEEICERHDKFLEQCSSVTDANINYKKAEFTNDFKRMAHLLQWIKSCTGGQSDLHSYSRKYPKAVAFVENNPNRPTRTQRVLLHSRRTWSSFATAFRPKHDSCKRGRESGILACAKGSKAP